MRACFLAQNVTTLGFGVAMLQTPPLPEPEPREHPVKDAGEQGSVPPEAAKKPEPA